jgi:hypothetical protein
MLYKLFSRIFFNHLKSVKQFRLLVLDNFIAINLLIVR